MILTVNPVIDGDDTGHRGSGHESGGDSGSSFLPSDPLFHQPDIALLLLVSTTLRAKGGFQNVMQFDLVSNAVLRVKRPEAMYLRCHTGIV